MTILANSDWERYDAWATKPRDSDAEMEIDFGDRVKGYGDLVKSWDSKSEPIIEYDQVSKKYNLIYDVDNCVSRVDLHLFSRYLWRECYHFYQLESKDHSQEHIANFPRHFVVLREVNKWFCLLPHDRSGLPPQTVNGGVGAMMRSFLGKRSEHQLVAFRDLQGSIVGRFNSLSSFFHNLPLEIKPAEREGGEMRAPEEKSDEWGRKIR